MRRILTAMSGGVDSAAACVLLRRAGYEVGGATMLLRCGGEAEAEDARRAAGQIGVPFHLFAWQEEFQNNVIEPFTEVYRQGGTPNPCIFCNKTMKFGLFLEQAMQLGYDGIATGHYCRLDRDTNGRYLLYRGRDESKDQSYMLYSLSQAQLAHTLFPLGDLTKAEVRDLAAQCGLQVAAKHDSQDICFVPDGDYMGYLTAHGLVPQPGRFRDMQGRDLGPHKGYEAYTIGQRRGLEIAAGHRIYVVEKRDGDVIIGPGEALFSSRVYVRDVNFIAFESLQSPMQVQAKLRYTPRMADCVMHPWEHGVVLEFAQPQRAVTAGQAAVFYDGDVVIGGGTICTAPDKTKQ